MATLDEALSALRKADAAGNAEDARRLAKIVDQLRNQPVDSGEDFGVGDYAQSLGAGINRGLVSMAGAPVDLVNFGLKQVGLGSDRPVGGSQQLMEDVFGSTETGRGMVAPGATDPTGQFLGRVGQEVGASVLPGAGIVGAATRGAPAARSLWGAFANPIRNAPARASAAELAAATGAGAGAGIAEQVAPGNVYAELGAQFAGGMAPAALFGTPAAFASRVAADTARRMSGKEATRRGREAVSEVLGEQLTPEVGAQLSEGDRLSRTIPGFKPSLGEATGSQALLRQQEAVERGASGADLDALAARKQGSEEAIQRHSERVAPGQEGTPEFIVDSATRTLDDLRGGLTKEAQDAQVARERTAEGLPRADRAAAGQTLRNRLIEQRRGVSQQMNARASELGIDDVDLTAPFEQFRGQLVDEFQRSSIFQDAANEPSIINQLRDFEGDAITFRDVKALRERISDDLIDAMAGANPSRKKVRELTLMKERLDGWVNNLDGEFGEVAGAWRDFRREYFEQYIDRFEHGTALKVRQRDGAGYYVTRDEKVAETFFQPRDVTAARQYKQVYGDDPEAMAAVESVALDSLRDSAVRKGVVDPLRLQAWRERHASILEEFPQIKQAVDNVETANTSVHARQEQIAARQKQLEDQMLVRELSAYQRGTRDAPHIVDSSVLREPRKMKALVGFLEGKPEALGALKRQIWNTVSNQDSNGILRTLNDNAASLKQLYGKKHFEALTDIALARQMMERTPSPRGAAVERRPLAAVEEAVGQRLPQLASRLFAFKSGRMQKGYLASDTFLRGLRGRAAVSMNQVWREALYDSELARDLAFAIRKGQMEPELARRLNSRLFALGLTAAEEEEAN